MTTHSPLTRLIPMLTRRARRLARSQSEAEDLVQDTLLRVIKRLRTGKRIDDLPAYAMRTLHNQARMLWRKRPVLQMLEEDHAVIEPEAPLRLECGDTLRAIEQLPPHQARLLRMVVRGETSPAILARRLGVPTGTVMSRLARARARLREILG